MIIGRSISSEGFTYIKQDKTFAIEASQVKGFPFTGQLYDDACDIGFVLVSHKTGHSQPYYLKEEYKNKDGDYTHWEFCPAYPVREGAKGTKVIVFND